MSALIRAVFGQSVWAASEGTPLNRTVRSLVAAGKRLYIEGHEENFGLADDKVVFGEALWSHQFGDESLEAYPNCAIDGDGDWYTPLGGPPRSLVRGLYNRGSDLSAPEQGRDATAAVRTKAAACAAQIVSPNYWQPADSADFVWTWARGEPSSSGECVVLRAADGRWATSPCAFAMVKLGFACRAAADDLKWEIASWALGCPRGFLAVPPTNGRANAKLRDAVAAAGVQGALLNISITGRGASPAAHLDRAEMII